ncbi:hypothetical protein D9M71_231230 [compost metagenome]
MVAAQFSRALVHGHAGIAALALRQPAAIVTEQCRGEAAAVEKYQHLLPGGQGLADGLLHWPADAAVQRSAFHIQAQEPWLLRPAGTVVQAQQAVTAIVGVVQAFQ